MLIQVYMIDSIVPPDCQSEILICWTATQDMSWMVFQQAPLSPPIRISIEWSDTAQMLF